MRLSCLFAIQNRTEVESSFTVCLDYTGTGRTTKGKEIVYLEPARYYTKGEAGCYTRLTWGELWVFGWFVAVASNIRWSSSLIKKREESSCWPSGITDKCTIVIPDSRINTWQMRLLLGSLGGWCPGWFNGPFTNQSCNRVHYINSDSGHGKGKRTLAIIPEEMKLCFVGGDKTDIEV